MTFAGVITLTEDTGFFIELGFFQFFAPFFDNQGMTPFFLG